MDKKEKNNEQINDQQTRVYVTQIYHYHHHLFFFYLKKTLLFLSLLSYLPKRLKGNMRYFTFEVQ